MKIFHNIDDLNKALEKLEGKKLVFTNGVFDLIHAGHIDLLEFARGCAELSVRLDDSHALARRISHSAVPVHVATVAGLLIAEFVGLLGSGRQARIVLFKLDHLRAEVDGPAQK